MKKLFSKVLIAFIVLPIVWLPGCASPEGRNSERSEVFALDGPAGSKLVTTGDGQFHKLEDRHPAPSQTTAIERAWPHLRKGMSSGELNSKYDIGFKMVVLASDPIDVEVVGKYKMTFRYGRLDSWEIVNH